MTNFQQQSEFRRRSKAAKKLRGEAVRRENEALFREAGAKAKAGGMVLRRLTGQHFQLINRQAGWQLELYPAKQLIRGSPGAPHIALRPWTLLDVVVAVIGG